MSSNLVQVTHVSKEYSLGSQKVTALTDISLSVTRGEFLAIAGSSGSGKTTLLNLIGCIDEPTTGTIAIDGIDVTNRSLDEIAKLRAKHIGFIFQTFNLLPVLTARENIEFPLLNRPDIPGEVRLKRVNHYLRMVGLDKVAGHRPDQMSGGQRQRVAIARALAGEPSIILADEPTANLDRETGLNILALMKHINRRASATFIFSTHDPKVIAMATRIVRVVDGKIVRPELVMRRESELAEDPVTHKND